MYLSKILIVLEIWIEFDFGSFLQLYEVKCKTISQKADKRSTKMTSKTENNSTITA